MERKDRRQSRLYRRRMVEEGVAEEGAAEEGAADPVVGVVIKNMVIRTLTGLIDLIGELLDRKVREWGKRISQRGWENQGQCYVDLNPSLGNQNTCTVSVAGGNPDTQDAD